MSEYVAACEADRYNTPTARQEEAERRKARFRRPTEPEGGGVIEDNGDGNVRRNHPVRRSGRRPPAQVVRRHVPSSSEPVLRR